MATLMGETLMVEYPYQACQILLGETENIANLMVLGMTDFNVILGMDWLASCHATLDYRSKTIKFSMSRELTFSFQGDMSEVPSNLISLLGKLGFFKRGCKGYLALAKDVDKETMTLDSVLVVKEFPDIFPEELLGLPSNREIKFNIDVVSRTQPIFIPPYRIASKELKELIASKELKELKEQLWDLLDKVFI